MTFAPPIDGALLSAPSERYEITGLLGGGAAGMVWTAVDRLLDRRVAVKEFAATTRTRDALLHAREAASLASVSHPALVSLHDVLLEVIDGEVAVRLVMELVEGKDLRAALRERPLPHREVLAIGADVSAALAHLHDRRLLHCDVKPANVLLVASPARHGVVAKLADLGVARALDPGEESVISEAGSAAYLSPEQVRGLPVSAKSDVYALGLTLLEALTGRSAHPGDAGRTIRRRLTRPPVGLDGVSEPLRGLIRRMCASDPSERPTAASVERDLRAMLAPSTGPAADRTHDFLGAVGDRVGVSAVFLQRADAAVLSVAACPRRISARDLMTLAASCAGPRTPGTTVIRLSSGDRVGVLGDGVSSRALREALVEAAAEGPRLPHGWLAIELPCATR